MSELGSEGALADLAGVQAASAAWGWPLAQGALAGLVWLHGCLHGSKRCPEAPFVPERLCWPVATGFVLPPHCACVRRAPQDRGPHPLPTAVL